MSASKYSQYLGLGHFMLRHWRRLDVSNVLGKGFPSSYYLEESALDDVMLMEYVDCASHFPTLAANMFIQHKDAIFCSRLFCQSALSILNEIRKKQDLQECNLVGT